MISVTNRRPAEIAKDLLRLLAEMPTLTVLGIAEVSGLTEQQVKHYLYLNKIYVVPEPGELAANLYALSKIPEHGQLAFYLQHKGEPPYAFGPAAMIAAKELRKQARKAKAESTKNAIDLERGDMLVFKCGDYECRAKISHLHIHSETVEIQAIANTIDTFELLIPHKTKMEVAL